jgi:hypothetical protein
MAEKIKRVGNTVRRENKVKNFKHTLSLALVSGLIIIAALIGLKMAEKTSVDALTSSDKQSGSYPVSFSTNDIRNVKSVSNNVVVLTKKFATVLDKGGDIVREIPVSYGDAAIYTVGSRMLIFDRLSNKYSLVDKKGNVTERKADESSKIYNAVVTEKGKVLMSLKSDNSSSLVSVKDKNGEDLFIWSCTQEYITHLALSDNEKTLYCAGISAENGEMYTKIYAINIKKGLEKSYILPSQAVIGLNGISSDKFNVLTTDGLYIFNSDKEDMMVSSVQFNSDIICRAEDKNGNFAVVTHSASDLSQDILTVYSYKAEEKFSISVQDDIQDICVNNDEVYLLYSDSIVKVRKGKVADTLTFENKAVGLCENSGQLYCYSLGGVEKVR